MFTRLLMEPPIRVLVRTLLKWLPISVETRTLWEISPRPHYLLGVYTAANLALKDNIDKICVVEFGVAGGNGLLALEEAAQAVEKETGVTILVYGFDAGPGGLPNFCGDYRDHPDFWKPGDFQMDIDTLKKKIGKRTELILGDVVDTVPHFINKIQQVPVGFVSIDLDLYSSTTNALQLFSHPSKKMLKQTPIYLDDIALIINHQFAGELLAIDEFNQENSDVKIDIWHGVKHGRPFPERTYFDQMFVAHDLKAISNTVLERNNVDLELTK